MSALNALKHARNRAQHALQYGADMDSSRVLCLNDVVTLLAPHYADTSEGRVVIKFATEAIHFRDTNNGRPFFREVLAYVDGYLNALSTWGVK